MKPTKQQTSVWRQTLDELLRQSNAQALVASNFRTLYRSRTQPDDVEGWTSAINEALFSGDERILDYVLETCSAVGETLKFLRVSGRHTSSIASFHLWKCVAQLKIEEVHISNALLFRTKPPLPKWISEIKLNCLSVLQCSFGSSEVFNDFASVKSFKKLRIDSSKMQSQAPLPDLVKILPGLEEFEFSLRTDTVGALFDPKFLVTLKASCKLKKLCLHYVPSDYLFELLEALENNRTITSISVMSGVFAPGNIQAIYKAANALARFVRSNPEIEAISYFVADHTQQTSPQSLFTEVMAAIGKSRRIKVVKLDGPKDDHFLKPLINHPTLEILQLRNRTSSATNDISDSAFDDLVRVVETAKQLKKLGLPSYQGYDPHNISRLTDVFARSENLVALDLRSVRAAPDALNRALAEIAQNPRLLHLAYQAINNFNLEYLNDNSTVISVKAYPRGEIDEDDEEVSDSELDYEISDFVERIAMLTAYNRRFASKEQLDQVKRAFRAFMQAVRTADDLGELLRERLMIDLTGAKTSIHLRELNRQAAGLPHSPWRTKFDELIRPMPRYILEGLSNQNVDCSRIVGGDQPTDNDLEGWGALISAVICTSNHKLVEYVLNSPPPQLNVLRVGKNKPDLNKTRLTPAPLGLSLALERLPVTELELRGLTLSNDWFKALNYFFDANNLSVLSFAFCASPDEPYGKLIQALNRRRPIALRFSSVTHVLPSMDIFTSLKESASVREFHYPSPLIHQGCISELNDNEMLQELVFSGRLIGDACRELTTLLQTRSLTRLALDRSELNDERLAILIEGFRTTQPLQILDLSHNSFTPVQENSLIEALRANRGIQTIVPWNIYWSDFNREKYQTLLGGRLRIPEANPR